MDKYICKICATIYDPILGDSEDNIPAGTPFENLPDTWRCPVCGSSKDKYEFLTQEKYDKLFPGK